MEPTVYAVGDVTTALTGAITTIASDAMGAITAILPVALPIVGAGVVVSIGLKVFKRVSGARG